MTQQCTAEYFANELNRYRQLTQLETDKLMAAMKGSTATQRRLWTGRDDRELKRLVGSHQASAIAKMTGRTVWAVRSRIRTLKRKEKAGE